MGNTLQKLRQFCAYQERCFQETRLKCLELGLQGEEVEAAMADLITENFLNEERFAKAYAGGKFRTKQWGRCKIKMLLKQKGISPSCILTAMKEIDEEDYVMVLQTLVKKKYRMLKAEQSLKRKYKTVQYLLQKGFEKELIMETLEQIAKNKA